MLQRVNTLTCPNQLTEPFMKYVLTLIVFFIFYELTAHPGIGIVMDSRGNVFYTDLTHVWKIDPTGKKTIAVRNVHTHELYIDKDDNLFGEHLWYSGEATNEWWYYVWRLSKDNKLEKIVADTKGFRNKNTFVHDASHNDYWVNDTCKDCLYLMKKTDDGVASRVGHDCFKKVHWLHASRQGNLYFTDGANLIKVTTDGKSDTLATNLPGKKFSQTLTTNENHYLSGLSSDENANVYVADYSGRAVKKVTRDGEVSVVVATRLPWGPTGTLLAPNGDFWILETSITNAVRVEKITKDGRRIIY